jgi:hypothetical protein
LYGLFTLAKDLIELNFFLILPKTGNLFCGKTVFKVNSIWGNVDVPQPLHISLNTSAEDLGTEKGVLFI